MAKAAIPAKYCKTELAILAVEIRAKLVELREIDRKYGANK